MHNGLFVMRMVVQRVAAAEVVVAGDTVGKAGPGLLVFLGIEKTDTSNDMEWLADKLPRIRCFEDDEGRMNRCLLDTGGDVMVISQFTLFGSLRKGTRPSFNRAAAPGQAVPLYEAFVRRVEQLVGKPVAAGVFGAEMRITAVNDGPVTLVVDTANRDF
jgi:D-aminoacyl-tRNA deacylase